MPQPLDPETLARLRASGMLPSFDPATMQIAQAPSATPQSIAGALGWQPPPATPPPPTQRPIALTSELVAHGLGQATRQEIAAQTGAPLTPARIASRLGWDTGRRLPSPAAAPAVSWQQPQAQQGPAMPSAPRPGVIPAHDVPIIAPERLQERLSALGEQGKAQVEGVAAEQRNNAQAAGLQQWESDIAQGEAQYGNRRAQYIREQDAALFAHADAMDRWAAQGQIDPERVLKTMNVGQKIAGVMGVFLGTLGSSLSKTPNYALQILEKRIDQDIDAQKHDLQSKKELAAANRGLLADKLRINGDPNVAEAAAKADYWKSVELLAAHQASQTNDGIFRARMLDMQAQARLKQADARDAAMRYMQATATGEDPRAAYLKYAKAETDKGEQALPFGEWYPRIYGGQGGPATMERPKPAAAGGRAEDLMNRYDAALRTLYQMRARMDQGGSLSPAERAAGEAQVASLINTIPKIETGGSRAPSPQEAELIRQQLPDNPAAFHITGADRARLEQTIHKLESERAAAAGQPQQPNVEQLVRPP